MLVGPALLAQPDRRLVALSREGHEPAVEEVVRRYRPALVRYAATIVPADRADDVVQDSIARALPRIRDGDAELNLRPWLYTIVRNTALNNVRDAGPGMDHLDENYDGVEQPPQAIERRQDLAAMVAGVQALPETQREALVKREMEGMSHSEIGAALGVSVGAARQLIHRGRMSLRDGLGLAIPMPVMRQLLEGISGPASAGTGIGGALAAKAIVAVLVAGGAVTAGVALDRHSHGSAQADPVVAQKRGQSPGAAESAGATASARLDAGGDPGRRGHGHGAGRQGAGREGSGGSSGQALGAGGSGAGSGAGRGGQDQAPAAIGDDGPQRGSGQGSGGHHQGEGGPGGGDDVGHLGSGGGSEHGGSGDEGSGGHSVGSGDGSGSSSEGSSHGDEGSGSGTPPESSGTSGSGDGSSGDGADSGTGSGSGSDVEPAHPEGL